jgi:hypothetical protein
MSSGARLRLRKTVGNRNWMRLYWRAVMSGIPQQWTEWDTGAMLRFGFHLKTLGVDWSGEQDLALCLAWLSHLGIVKMEKRQSVTDLSNQLLFCRQPDPFFKLDI